MLTCLPKEIFNFLCSPFLATTCQHVCRAQDSIIRELILGAENEGPYKVGSLITVVVEQFGEGDVGRSNTLPETRSARNVEYHVYTSKLSFIGMRPLHLQNRKRSQF